MDELQGFGKDNDEALKRDVKSPTLIQSVLPWHEPACR